MADSRYALAIDLGTSGPKVALVGADGHVAAHTNRTVRTRRLPPDGAEQDPKEIWQAIVEAVQQVLGDAGKSPEEIVGVLCSSHYFSLVPVDANGNATTSLLVWNDRRGAAYGTRLVKDDMNALMKWIEIHGALPFGTESLSHMLYVKNDLPEAYERTHCFVEPMDFVNARLTGKFTANCCTAFALMLTDNRDLSSLEYDPDLVALSGIDPAKLPKLIPVDSVIGTVLPAIAGELGLSPDTPVFSGINDTQAVTIGTGTYLRGRGGLNVGTTIQVLARAEEKNTDGEYQIVSMPSPIPGDYMSMVEVGLGGRLVEHFLLNVVYATDALGEHTVEDPWAWIDATVRNVAPGSGGLLFLPWLEGAQAPKQSDTMRGGFLNISLETTRAAMLRAVLEGVSYHLRWMLPGVEAFSKQTFDTLYYSGGGAVSDEWAQIMADVTGRPILQLADARQANTRGAAFLVFSRLGLATDDDIDAFCPIRKRYAPRPDAQKIYDHLFEQFILAYEQTEPIYDALNRS
ncbi:MAG: FGGY-family carbohydrate kinase [Candidatus Binatia bacterium]|nr:FGGY-family carbohydrate kinase [Candidatus Binatia bacterium]